MVTFVMLITYVILGIVYVSLAVPLIQGRIKPNGWYGVRVPKTLNDSQTWYAVNAYFGRRFAVVGVAIIAAGVLFCPFGFIPKSGPLVYMLTVNFLMLGALVAIVIDTFRYLRKF